MEKKPYSLAVLMVVQQSFLWAYFAYRFFHPDFMRTQLENTAGMVAAMIIGGFPSVYLSKWWVRRRRASS